MGLPSFSMTTSQAYGTGDKYFFILFQGGKSYEQLKAELGDATDLIKITVVGYSFFKW